MHPELNRSRLVIIILVVSPIYEAKTMDLYISKFNHLCTLHVVPDLCDSGYCENGGSCTRTGLDAYDCTCAGSWSGTTCTSMCVKVLTSFNKM